MTPATSAAAIKAHMNDIRDAATSFLTNWYVDDAALAAWVARGQMLSAVIDVQKEDGAGKVLFLLRHRAEASALYFAATSPEAFYAALPQIVQATEAYGPTAFDIVEKGTTVSDALQAQGYPLYRTLFRMRYVPKGGDTFEPPEDDGAVYAKPEEAEAVCALFHATMDPYCEQVPDLADIEQQIERHEVLVYHHEPDGAIEAALSYHVQGAAVQWLYWATQPEWRQNGNGMKLYARYRYLMRDKRSMILWVRDNNPVQKIHRYFHFHEDGLRDFVFLFHHGLQEATHERRTGNH